MALRNPDGRDLSRRGMERALRAVRAGICGDRVSSGATALKISRSRPRIVPLSVRPCRYQGVGLDETARIRPAYPGFMDRRTHRGPQRESNAALVLVSAHDAM